MGSSDEIIVFTDDGCPPCIDAVQLLEDEGVDYIEYNIADSEENGKKYRKRKGENLPFLIIGEQRIAGFDPAAIESALAAFYGHLEEGGEGEGEETARGSVVMYTNTDCVQCEKARQLFQKYDIEYIEYDFADPESHEVYEEMEGRGGLLILIGRHRIQTFSEDIVRIALEQEGLL